MGKINFPAEWTTLFCFFSGEYIDDQGHCQTCEASCAKCWGPTQEDCISCPVTRVLDDGRCVMNCPSWKFEFKKQCHPCHYTCQGCQGSGPSNCTSCRADKHGQERFLYHGECLENCPVGHYPAKGHACLPCPDNCELCYNPHVCSRCMSGYVIIPPNHTCQKLECRQGEFQDSEYEECMPCEEGCLGCTEDDPGACTSCATGYYMFERHCYKACPEKTFGVKWECRACGTNCGSCDQHECYWCEEGFFLSGGSCVQDCGPGFHGDQELGECKPCHRACETCTGSGYNQCSSCQEGLQLWHGTCLWSTWPQVEGKDWNDATSQNQPCHSSCKTCNGSLCASCPTGMYLWLQACVPSCPQGTWPSVTSGSCEKCSEDCVSCSGADLCQQCLSQPDNTLLLHEGRCYHSCPEGFYAKDGVCEHCSSPCKTCEGNATSCNSCEGDFVLDHGVCWKTCPEKHVAVEGVCKHCPERCQDCIHEKTCKECMPDFFLYNDMCHRSCPKSFYPDMRQCVPCHKNCLECNGPKEDDCKVCADTSKALHNGLCLDECPEGTYKEEENDECRDCPESCLICSSAWTCLACREGFTVVHDVCTAPKECAAVEYWDEGSHRCQPCHKKCSRCSGPSEDQCYTCPRETFLLNTTCVKECPEGYHTDKDSQQCVLCHSSCRTCEGPHSMQCLSCRPGWFQLGKECLLQCRDGYYGESTSGRCEKCDKSCKSCRGPRPTDCQSCDTFFFLLRSKGQCHRACPEHYYADQHAQTCERCHPTCDKCSGKEAWSCLSCVWSYHLLKGICIPECIVGEYREGKGENFNCKKCHESCMECKGPGSKNCTGCSAGLLLDMDDNRCLHCCNASHSRRSQDCCDCQSSTDECILPAREAEFYEHTKTALLVTSGAMLLLLLGAAAVVWRKSRSRPVAKGRYEKLAEPTVSYSSYRSSYLDEDQVIEYRDRDYDEDDEDDIVYMGQDGTVYRKFKYGLLDETEDDELEYDDESYSYQ